MAIKCDAKSLVSAAACIGRCLPQNIHWSALIFVSCARLNQSQSQSPPSPPPPPLIWTSSTANLPNIWIQKTDASYSYLTPVQAATMDLSVIMEIHTWDFLTAPNFLTTISNINSCVNLQMLDCSSCYHLTSIAGLTNCKKLGYVDISAPFSLPISQAQIDNILVSLDNGGSPYVNGGTIIYTNRGSPSATGLAAENDLKNNHGWTVTT